MLNLTKNKKITLKKIQNLLLIIVYLTAGNSIQAQCAMCRASLEGEGNVAKAQAVNDGIVYLMVIPYVLAGFVAVIIYKMYKNKK
ncbi:MAG: hypothetical protein H7174_08300 [Flavobacterium sp.]|nr:hypothetical protein [Flavobacterium sp.]